LKQPFTKHSESILFIFILSMTVQLQFRNNHNMQILIMRLVFFTRSS